MTEQKHTAAPWKIGTVGDICYGEGGWSGVKLYTGWTESAWKDDDEAKANAAFIVRAVNSHEALVEALHEIIKCDRKHGINPKTTSERHVWFDGPCAEIARAALSATEALADYDEEG